MICLPLLQRPSDNDSHGFASGTWGPPWWGSPGRRECHESPTEQGHPALRVQILDISQGGNQVLIPDLAQPG